MPASHTSATTLPFTPGFIVQAGLASSISFVAFQQSAVPVVGYSSWTSISIGPNGKGSTVVKDLNYGGHGQISGTTQIQGSPNALVMRRVRLFRDIDGQIVRGQWSDPVTGAYLFTNIDPSYTYTVIAYDYTFTYRAVVADNLTPDPW